MKITFQRKIIICCSLILSSRFCEIDGATLSNLVGVHLENMYGLLVLEGITKQIATISPKFEEEKNSMLACIEWEKVRAPNNHISII